MLSAKKIAVITIARYIEHANPNKEKYQSEDNFQGSERGKSTKAQ